MATLQQLEFDNRFTRSLPADPESGDRRRQLLAALYSRVEPTPVSAPQVIAVSSAVADLLGIDVAQQRSQAFAEVFSGNRLLPGMDAHASCYGGHQFGHWAGQLGDGRAINLGEVLATDGSHQMLQLKGAGLTPYSRTADGLAVLRSSVREFLCSEAMHYLGVPTTRALSLALTGERVLRDMLYDGNAAHEPGAIVCRVAPTFLRFGHFQMLTARGEIDLLRQLADFVIRTEFADILQQEQRQGAALEVCDYLRWFRAVCSRTAVMIVGWMRTGFVHGVMNTDNMSITGLTIDYGPYGWLEDYDPDWTPNTTDAATRRYRFGQQPAVAGWNLTQLANAIVPLIGATEPLEAALNDYRVRYRMLWQSCCAAKLGLQADLHDPEAGAATEPLSVAALYDDLERILVMTETDMTVFFRALIDVSAGATPATARARIEPAFYAPESIDAATRGAFDAWFARYLKVISGIDADQRRARMTAANPKYVLRNYLAQLAIDRAEQGDYTGISELLDLLRRPYDEQPEREQFAALRPDWARTRVGCSQLSCSS